MKYYIKTQKHSKKNLEKPPVKNRSNRTQRPVHNSYAASMHRLFPEREWWNTEYRDCTEYRDHTEYRRR